MPTAAAPLQATPGPGAAPLSGRHAIVTGAGSGIGAAVAQALAAQGARVSLLGRRPAPLQALAQQISAAHSGQAPTAPQPAQAFTADVRSPEEVHAAFAQARALAGPVHILVNNAGQAHSAPFLQTDLALWQRMLDVNLTGSFLCTQAALPDMLTTGWGRVVNIASTAALVGYPYVSAYVAAKHAVLGLTRALALEVARKGITVNAVCPGYTETPLLRDSVERVMAATGRSEEQARAAFSRSNPQGRLVQAAEVADTVAWLCLPGSASVHGQSIAVCGGEVMV